MSKLVFDIESDGLLDTITKIWIIVTQDVETNEVNVYCDLDKTAKPLKAGLQKMSEADVLIGHFIIGFDLPALKKILGWAPKPETRIIDTVIMSQCLDYKRFGFGHSLDRWGEHLGHKKPEHEDWTQYSPEMRHRCTEDVAINVKAYHTLVKELEQVPGTNFRKVLRAEHRAAEFSAAGMLRGWDFDVLGALKLQEELLKRMLEIENRVNPMLKLTIKAVDKDPEFKAVTWVKNGNYAMSVARWFDIPPEKGLTERPVWGNYCRVEVVQPDIGSMDSVKILLYANGWVPDEWNMVAKGGRKVRTTPKLTDSSLEPLGQLGRDISRYYTLRARNSILNGWLEKVNPETGRIHGDCFVIGTPTFRAVHKIVANIPSGGADVRMSRGGRWVELKKEEKKELGLKNDYDNAHPWVPDEVGPEGTVITVADSSYGPQIRHLFTSPKGWTMIGADSSGNQMRGLCHYLGNAEFSDTVINGDVHQANADALTKDLGFIVTRTAVKRILYAVLFGASDGKLGIYATGKSDREVGGKIRKSLYNVIPGLGKLMAKLEGQFNVTAEHFGKSYIKGITGRKVFVTGKHMILVYLLQELEKATVSLSMQWLMEKLEEEKIPYEPLIMYHDEIEFLVPDAHAERAAELSKLAFAEGPKMIGVTIMSGDSKMGKTWRDVH